MANALVWDDKVHLLLGELIYAHFYVYVRWSDVDSDLQHAFDIQVTIRAGGVQLWDTGVLPLKDGQLTAKPAVAVLPVIEGELDDWDCLDANGDHGNWPKATLLTFLVSAKTDVTIPISEICAALATLGPAGIAAAAVVKLATTFGSKKARITIGHTNVAIPVARDTAGRITQIGHASRSLVAKG